MKHLLTLIGLLVLTIGKAQLSFAPATNYGVGSSPSSLISADFDGDGKVDLAVANSFFSNVSILLGSGTGTFATAINYGVGTKPYSVISADFNGDGKVDLATANYTSNDVSILIGSGTGTFVASVNYGVGTNPMSIFSADFNGDGKADLAVTNYNSNNVSILLGSGTGTFAAAVNYVAGNKPRSLTSADFNGDGKADLAVTNYNSNNVSILLGSGTGTFAAAVNYAVGTNPSSVLSSDFNGDGKLDLAVTNNYGGNASILLGSGSGAFAASINYWSGGNPGYIISGDLNGDGIADLAMSNFGQNNVSVLLGSGIGTFAGNINFGTGNGPESIISADFNGDSKVDLATVNISGNDVSILLNTTPILAAALDFDGVNDIVNIGSTTSINNMGLGGFSLESWLYPHTASGAQSIIRKSGDYNLYINNGYLTAEIWYLGTGNPNLITITGTSTITLNAWSHVACTWDGSNGRLYIDGLEISTSLSANTITTSEVLSLGASSVYGNYLNGNLDEVRIWNIVRTQCEINTYKNCEISTIANGLVANYHFNQGYDSGNNTTTTALVDASGSTNTGTLTNFALTTGTISNWVAPGGVVSGYTISANVVPTISATATNPIICNGATTTLNASGADTYTWTGGVTNAIAFTPTVTTSYTVTGTNTITGCSNTSINTVTVNSLPTLSITSTNSVCINSSATINALGASTYTWNTGSISASISVSPTITTTYSVIGTNTLGCSSTQTISISVHPTPTISVNSGSICSGSNFTFNSSGGVTYTYSSNSATVAPNISSTYTVYGSDALGCYGSAISSITVSPSPTISVNSGSICIGDSFTITPSGAISYTYSSINPILTPSVTNTYTITGEDALGCVSSLVNSITVNSLPTLFISSTNSVCINSSATINALGALSYTWNTGSTTASINITPTITSIYIVTGTDANNCSATQTVTITVDNTCQDVWPGDANSDGVADNIDVLELGLHYTQTGTPRATTSNLWQSYYAANWGGTITNGANLNHSDCNGDGIINNDDTLAIFNNYSLTHAFKPAQTTTNPVLTIVPDQSSVAKGTWGTSSVYLGDASTQISNINGIAYTISYDNTLLETDSVWIEYPTSFINASNQNLKFRKRDFSNGKLYTATTHTINGNVNGYGKIAILHYKIKSSLITDNVLSLSISQANQSNASGVITPLTASSATLMAIGASVGLNELTNGNYISLHPNPTNGVLTINSTTELQKIDVMAITGQLLLSEVPVSTSHVLHLDHLANGVYFVNLYQNNRIMKREKIILNK